MDKATREVLTTSIRKAVTFTFTNTTGAAVDAGRGFSFVGFEIPIALDAGTMTFKKGAGGDDADTIPSAFYPVNVEDNDGDVNAPYTVNHGTDTDYFPLDPVAFNGARWLELTSSSDQSAKTVTLIAKPV